MQSDLKERQNDNKGFQNGQKVIENNYEEM